jgi:hypothetical protein
MSHGSNYMRSNSVLSSRELMKKVTREDATTQKAFKHFEVSSRKKTKKFLGQMMKSDDSVKYLPIMK